ncbi:MAG: ROK family transcriptional regulator [Hyphomicrobiales bacterium]|nr:ROK family transcriptional regulator [Hyphomicrobiales bacterium]
MPPPHAGLTQSRYHTGVTGANLENTKRHNRRVVLETIRIHGPVERAAIVERTQLAVQTVSNIVNELLEDRLIRKCPAEPGRRGQPAHPLDIEPDGAHSIGLSIDQRTVLGCITNLAGQALASDEVDIVGLTGEEAFDRIVALVDRLKQEKRRQQSPILGVGLAVAGPFGIRSYLADAPTAAPNWLSNQLVEELRRAVGLPIEIISDSMASTIGQRVYGGGRERDSFAHLFVGFGVAVGYFLNGRVYLGADGNAGEIGHAVLMPDGHECFCGNRGCLEQYLSLYSVNRYLGVDTSDPEDLQRFCERVDNPDAATRQWLDDAAEALRRAVQILEQLLGARSIIVGGYMPASILRTIIEMANPPYRSVRERDDGGPPRVLLGTVGREVGVISAAALPLYSSYDPALDIKLK